MDIRPYHTSKTPKEDLGYLMDTDKLGLLAVFLLSFFLIVRHRYGLESLQIAMLTWPMSRTVDPFFRSIESSQRT